MKKRLKESSDASVTVCTPPPPDSPTASAAGDTHSGKPTEVPALRATLDRARELAAKVQRRAEEKDEERDEQDTGVQGRLVEARVHVTAPLARGRH